MRLRKNMKRAAAAALALSVALSAAAPAALAKEYYIDDGNITVTVTEDGDTFVRVGKALDADTYRRREFLRDEKKDQYRKEYEEALRELDDDE